MSKYIVISVLVLIVGTFLFITSNSESKNVVMSIDSDKTLSEKQEQVEQVDQEEYVIDPSDMYTVEEVEKEVASSLLTANEEEWLIHMREEEKLARDVYSTLGSVWDMRVFSNIASSEQTHTDAIKTLLERYDVTDPVVDNTVGVFTLPEMQKLYDDFVKQGSQSLLDALIVGATIEDLDIFDLDKAISETVKADINTVYANLQKGSRNHLRAFIKNITKQGRVYTPQYVSASDFESIIFASSERGRVK